MDSAVRIAALFQRYLFLHRRSLIRVFDIVFWPLMELLIWGFMTLYLQQVTPALIAGTFIFLLGTMIGWDLHYRGQQAVTISLMEEIWTRNIVNILMAPIRLWEWITASFLYGAVKVLVVGLLLTLLARLLYGFNFFASGWIVVFLVFHLLMFGWAIGLGTAGLLLRFGYAAEALIWGIPFLIQPFSCVFYPLASLPGWAQPIARALPSTYAFEGLRLVMAGSSIPPSLWMMLIGLNGGAMVLAAVMFSVMFRQARRAGRLGRLGQD